MDKNNGASEPDPKSENNEKMADTRLQIISVCLGVAAVILLLVYLLLKKSYEEMPVGGELFLHFGMACLISGVLIYSVERITARFHLRLSEKRLRDISYNVFSAIFGRFIPEQINREVLDFVYKTDVYYKDYNFSMIGKEVEIRGEKLLQFDATSMMEVRNTTNRVVKYITPIKEINVDAGATVPFVEFQEMRILNNEKRLIKRIGKTDFLKQGHVKTIQGRYEIDLTVEIEIKPRDFIFVRLFKVVYLRQEKDWYNIALVKPAINMTLTAQFPPGKYNFWASAYRPNTTLDDPDRFTVDYPPPDGIEVVMIGGILPHQNLTLSYSRKPEPKP